MQPSLIRRIWSTIDTVAPTQLVSLTDTDLAERVSEELEYRLVLNPQDLEQVKRYVAQKAGLIRDMIRS